MRFLGSPLDGAATRGRQITVSKKRYRSSAGLGLSVRMCLGEYVVLDRTDAPSSVTAIAARIGHTFQSFRACVVISHGNL